MAYGRTLLSNSTVLPTRVSSDGRPIYKTGGISIDWSTVTAPGSDTTLADGSVVTSGRKYLRYGQVMTKITTAASSNLTAITLTGTATGGTFTYTLTRPDTGAPVTTGTIAYNASAATVLAAIQAVFPQAISATGGALGSAGVVVTFNTLVTNGTVNAALLTGGTVTTAVTTTGTGAGGKFGPYDPAASDGRQNLNRGDCFVIDETVLQYGGTGTTTGAQIEQVGAIEGGSIFIDRILQSVAATHTLALGPTLAEFTAAFPSFFFVKN